MKQDLLSQVLGCHGNSGCPFPRLSLRDKDALQRFGLELKVFDRCTSVRVGTGVRTGKSHSVGGIEIVMLCLDR